MTIPPLTALPASSWDTHVHVFDPERYPYVPDALYRPTPCSTSDLMNAVRARNFVVVMSGPEGTDPSLTLETIVQLRALGRQAKGVVVMDLEQMTASELKRLDYAGIRSVRFNTRRDGDDLDALERLFTEGARKFEEAGVRWSIEAAMFDFRLWHSLLPTLRRIHEASQIVFVADHVFACQPADQDTPEFSDLLNAIEDGVIMVKISGLTRYGRNPESMLPILKAILSRGDGQGGIWGSDWPHVISKPGSTGFSEVDLEHHLRLIKGVCDELGNGVWEKLTCENAAVLYA